MPPPPTSTHNPFGNSFKDMRANEQPVPLSWAELGLEQSWKRRSLCFPRESVLPAPAQA